MVTRDAARWRRLRWPQGCRRTGLRLSWALVPKSTWWRSGFFKPPNKATSTEKISLNSHLALAPSTSLPEHVWAYRGRRNYKPFCVRLLLFALKTFCSAFAFLLIQQNLILLRAVGAFCAKSFRSKLTHQRKKLSLARMFYGKMARSRPLPDCK